MAEVMLEEGVLEAEAVVEMVALEAGGWTPRVEAACTCNCATAAEPTGIAAGAGGHAH